MFPYKDYDTLDTRNLFGDFELSDALKEIFAKLVLNYPNYELAQTIPEDKKPLLAQYIDFLKKTYFSKEQVTFDNAALGGGGGNQHLLKVCQFTLEGNFIKKWNSIIEVLNEQQTFLRNDFIRLYNEFVEIQFNLLLAIATDSYNEYINRLNIIYDKNEFENKKLIFDSF